MNGRIQADGVSVNTSIELSTTNGSISERLRKRAGLHRERRHRQRLQQPRKLAGGAKKLSAHTTNGSIDIRFES
jgi:DUF4097 and DUF4098 domain-containing protein YvlB